MGPRSTPSKDEGIWATWDVISLHILPTVGASSKSYQHLSQHLRIVLGFRKICSGQRISTHSDLIKEQIILLGVVSLKTDSLQQSLPEKKKGGGGKIKTKTTTTKSNNKNHGKCESAYLCLSSCSISQILLIRFFHFHFKLNYIVILYSTAVPWQLLHL